MSFLLHRDLRTPPPVAVKGEGCYIFDRDGRRYLDASGGAAVSCLGHNHPAIIEAVQTQVAKLAYAHTGAFSSEPAEALAEALVQRAPGDIRSVLITSSGSEAIEASLKLARQYFLEKGEPNRVHIIARQQSYHGNTIGALSIGGNEARRKPYAPFLMTASHIAPCYEYRHRQPGESLEAYGVRAAQALEAEILRLGPENVAGFVAETVVGATLGAVPPAPSYFQRIRDICNRYGVLLILDEVMCGMGRTGSLHACEQESIAPDMMTIAKGLGAGYQPVGALMVSQRITDVIRQGSGQLMHGQTYFAHPVACAAALAVQKTLLAENLIQRVQDLGQVLGEALTQRFGQHPHVGDIRGRGLFWALELVADRDSKVPFDPALKLHAKIKKVAQEIGLLCYPSGGTVDGIAGDHVLLAPPFIASESQLHDAVDGLEGVLEMVLKKNV